MGTRDRREQRIRQNRRAVTRADLVALLTAAGFSCRRGKRGHWICVHTASEQWCAFAEPHGRGEPHLLIAYVQEALDALDRVRDWQREVER